MRMCFFPLSPVFADPFTNKILKGSYNDVYYYLQYSGQMFVMIPVLLVLPQTQK